MANLRGLVFEINGITPQFIGFGKPVRNDGCRTDKIFRISFRTGN